jgi:uncharacterized repeat protein (TIGR01451 family)
VTTTIEAAEEEPPPPPAGADLTITKLASTDKVRVGDLLAYTLSVRNDGPGEAPAATVRDTLPAGLT